MKKISVILFVTFVILLITACDSAEDSESSSQTVISEEGEWEHSEQNFYYKDN